MSFLAELKRRNVYRVGVLYVIVSWLVMQVTDVFTSVLTLPDWAGKLIFLILFLGFPVALVLAWAFELTPEGVRRDRDTGTKRPESQGGRKKIDFLILGALLVAVGYFAWHHDWRGDGSGMGSHGPITSLAVLPLENLMNDANQAYFVAGMHEALITELSRIEALRVISRTSTLGYQGSQKSIPEIASELGVDAVVEGSVLKAGDTVRVTVQLINADNDAHLWADNFDRELRDILALYGEVTREIAVQIRVTLSVEQEADIETNRPVNPQVYELYLKGRYLCENWSPVEMEQGIRLLQEAVSLEPQNAPAQAQLAVCLQYSAFYGYLSPLDALARARSAAVTAVQLDNDLADGHVALAGVQYYLEFEPGLAMQSLERALDLNPTNIRGLVHASWLLGESGRFAESMERIQQALHLDPLSTVVNHSLGQTYYLNRNFEEARSAYSKALDLDRSDPSMYFSIAWANEQLGDFDAAFAAHEKAIELSGGASLYRASLGYSYALAGMQEQAEEVLQQLEQAPETSAYELAIVQLGLGRHGLAMDGLEQAFEERDSHLIYINQDPKFDPLREEERFIALIERIGWPDADGK
jgi:TolB-like protein/Flp pilus assembly protein TadD